VSVEEGSRAADVEFTGDCHCALVSVWEIDGAIVVYDTTSHGEVKRGPVAKPSSKH